MHPSFLVVTNYKYFSFEDYPKHPLANFDLCNSGYWKAISEFLLLSQIDFLTPSVFVVFVYGHFLKGNLKGIEYYHLTK